jgi:hypothetical protein
MSACREIAKKHAAEYAKASKKAKGMKLDQLVATTGWSRANARRALTAARVRKGTTPLDWQYFPKGTNLALHSRAHVTPVNSTSEPGKLSTATPHKTVSKPSATRPNAH